MGSRKCSAAPDRCGRDPVPGEETFNLERLLLRLARTAVLETPVPPPRRLEEPQTWEGSQFQLLGGRRPSDILARSPIAILHPALAMTLLSLSKAAIGLAGVGYGTEQEMYESGIGFSSGRLLISRPRKVARRPFIWSWSGSALATAELRRCFDALTTRRTPDGRKITQRQWNILKENELLEKAGYSEKQRAALISSLDGRTPAAESMAISRARLKVGKRRRAEHERAKR